MEGEPKPPIFVRVTQYVFLFYALVNSVWLVTFATFALPRDDELLTGRLIFLTVILFAMSAFQIGGRTRYARMFAIASCLVIIFRAVRSIFPFDGGPDYFFLVIWLPQIVLFLSIAGYFAFSREVVSHFHPERAPRVADQPPPPPPSFDT